MIVSKKIHDYFQRGSAIRRMFYEGVQLKAEHGADNVADMSIGNPLFSPPHELERAMVEVASQPGLHGYMHNAGYEAVRRSVAENLIRNGHFKNIDMQHVVMTTGAAGAINVVLKTILNEGDEVIVPSPFFVEYHFYIDNHGGKMVLVDTTPDFDLDVDAIGRAIHARTRAILINSPNNPTGRVYPRATLVRLAQLLARKEGELGRPIFLISDEPYRELVFDGVEFSSPASLHPNSFMCYSWSKSFSIPGERVGYIAVNPEMQAGDWNELTGCLAMCNRFLGFVNAPAFMQRVVHRSMNAPVDIGHYRRKRDRICRTLDECGFEYVRPEGTFYVFPRCPIDESEFIRRAKEELLLVVPGRDFGRPGYFRLSFACSEATVELACRKLEHLADSVPA